MTTHTPPTGTADTATERGSMKTSDGWITLREAAQLAGVTKRTIERRVADGTLPSRMEVRGKQQIRLVWAEALLGDQVPAEEPIPPTETPTALVPIADMHRQVTAAVATLQSLGAEVRTVQEEQAALRHVIEEQARLIAAQTAAVEALTSELAEERARRPWWARILRRTE